MRACGKYMVDRDDYAHNPGNTLPQCFAGEASSLTPQLRQAVNLCVLPCIFGWENYKMQQDPEYARTMRMPMTVLHLLILCGEALFVCIFGLLTWMGVDTKCREKEVPTDLWVLFQITVVLWTISAACTACGACAVCCMLCGILPEPEGGLGAQQQGGHQAQPGEREDDPFVEQNPGGHPDV